MSMQRAFASGLTKLAGKVGQTPEPALPADQCSESSMSTVASLTLEGLGEHISLAISNTVGYRLKTLEDLHDGLASAQMDIQTELVVLKTGFDELVKKLAQEIDPPKIKAQLQQASKKLEKLEKDFSKTQGIEDALNARLNSQLENFSVKVDSALEEMKPQLKAEIMDEVNRVASKTPGQEHPPATREQDARVIDAERKAAEQKVAAEKAAAAEAAAAKQAAEEKAAAAEKKAAEEKAVAAKAAADEKAAEEKAAAIKKAAEEKAAAEKKATEEKAAAEKKVAEEKAAWEKELSAEEKAVCEKAAAAKNAATEKAAADEAAAAKAPAPEVEEVE